MSVPSWVDSYERYGDRRAVLAGPVHSGNDGDVTNSCATYCVLQNFNEPLCIDIGCAEGWWAEFVKSISPNARILAFEPNPTAFHALQTRWKNQPKLQILPYAVSNTHGMLYFSLEGEQSNSRGGGAVSIPCVNLNAFLKDPVAILKLDVEGHELEILESIQDKYSLIHAIVFEFTPKWYTSKERSVHLLKTLSNSYPFAYHLSRRHIIELYPLDLSNPEEFVQKMLDTQYQTDILVSKTPIQFPKSWP